MPAQQRSLSSIHSQRYNLRSSTDNTYTPASIHSRRVVNDGERTKITNFFVVRKRRGVSSDEENEYDEVKKRCRKTNSQNNDSDQVVPITDDKETRLTNKFPRWPRVAVVRDLPANPLGTFAAFSPETFAAVVDRIAVNELASLAITSNEFSQLVKQYAVSGLARIRVAKELYRNNVSDNSLMTSKDPFYAWGKLLKSITITECAADRIDYFLHFYIKNQNHSNQSGWGRCMLAFVEQWDFKECSHLMRALFTVAESGLFASLGEVMNEGNGQNAAKEMKVRCALREMFLDHRYKDSRDSSFWMSSVIRTQSSSIKQAKLMHILYGPTKLNDSLQGVIDWNGVCDDPVSTLRDSKERFGALSDALLRLLQTKSIGVSEFVYTESDVFNIIEEVTTYPEPWSFDNFVALLLNRPALVSIALVFRVAHGYEQEAGQMFSVMTTLLYRWRISVASHLERPLCQMLRALSRTQSIALLKAILRAQNEAILEAFDNFQGRRDEIVEQIYSSSSVAPLFALATLMF